MVLKGQVFMLDVSFAFFVLLLIFFSFLQVIALSNKTMVEGYENFVRQKRVLDASEKLVSIELAEYSENTLKHHVLSLDKINNFERLGLEKIKENLLLDDYDVSIVIKTEEGRLLGLGNASDGTVIKRIAICGGNVCVLEIHAE